MRFYTAVKSEFGEEQYLKLQSRSQRTSIARLRSSSHDLRIEKGRYTNSLYNKALKACRYCCSADTKILSNFEQLPFFEEPILESEEHVLTECPAYHHIRSNLPDNLKSLLMLKEYGAIMTSYLIPEFGKYLSDCYRHRNPKKSS